MELRMDYVEIAPKALGGMFAANTYFDTCSVDQKLRRLVELRVSQINGCSYCIWLHTDQARSLGESEERLAGVRDWRNTDAFSSAERAALDWAEDVTDIARGTPPDALFEELRANFQDRQIVDLTAIIANMCALNRMAISFRHEPPEGRDV